MDWSASGIRHTWEHHIVDSRTLEDVGLLDGVTSYTLTEAWRGDYRQTGSIDLDGEALPLWAAVRSYLVSELDGEVVRHELATLMPRPTSTTYKYSRGLQSFTLDSSLRKLDTFKQHRDVGVAAGTSVATHFTDCCTASGAVGLVYPGLTSALTRTSRVWEAGDSYLTECHAMAGACGGRVQPDSYGRVCLVPYHNPANVAETFEIPAGAASVTLPELVEAEPEIVNRVIASYSQNDQRWFSEATVDVSHPWHFAHIGRWETLEIETPTIPEGANVQDILDAATAAALAAHSDTRRTFSVQMAYMPIEVGEVGTLQYRSGDMDTISVLGFVSQRQIKQDGAAVYMELTIEEV